MALLVGSVGGATLSFLVQVVAQLSCHRVVITGPSCPRFSANTSALVLGALVGIVIAFSIGQAVSGRRRRRETGGA
jgi:hypothetical protein